MLIGDILRYKGTKVVTVAPGEGITDLLARLEERNIGGLVVTEDDVIVGIVSERDIVRRLHREGASVLSATVGDLMSTEVIRCLPADSVDDVAATMTEMRIRHMPVVSDGQLVGIVTIGDVVAARIRALEQERIQLESYITRG
jgi:CBS domain-containing protein